MRTETILVFALKAAAFMLGLAVADRYITPQLIGGSS